MKKGMLWAAAVVATAALAGILLLPPRLREQAVEKEVGAVAVEPITASSLPSEKRSEDWFVGDWLGLCAHDPETAGTLTDFGSALYRNVGDTVLLRVYRTAEGYGASIGGSVWKVTAHDMERICMVCTAQPQTRGGNAYPREEQFFLEPGATEAVFTYRGDVKSADPASHVPETNILSGQASVSSAGITYTFLLSFLPPAGQRDESGGIYPCWYGGYADMKGDFAGMALLGENSRNRRFFAQLLKTADGHMAMATVEDGYNTGGDRYGARDTRFEDVTRRVLVDTATQAYWPTFQRYAPSDVQLWADTSQAHALYYDLTYVAQLQLEIGRLEAGAQDIWTQNGILIRKALIRCAQMAAGYPGSVDIRQVLQQEEFLPAVSLAGLSPGDTLEDAEKRYSLREIHEDEAQRAGLYGVYDSTGFTHYTDGNGLVIQAIPDGRITRVAVYRAGYETPDNRQVGAPYDASRALLRCKNAAVMFGGQGDDAETGVITRIQMDGILDRVWDETMFDIDGDGKKERLTLSGRCEGGYLEQGTVHGDSEAGTVDADDYGTVPTLSIYKGESLVAQTPLHMYTYYLLPCFADNLQKKHRDLVICCPTGGTGGDAYYTLRKSGGNWRLTYLGIK